MTETTAIVLLRLASAGQIIIAILATRMARLLHWEEDIARMPLLLREVFRIHGFFLSFTLTLFSVLTWRFAPDLAGGGQPLASWLAGGIGLFWSIRTVFQWTFYSHDHWRGKPRETALHWTLTLIYGSWAALYWWCALR